MKRFLHIVLVVLAVAACQGPRVIPKDTMEDIYLDMFIADQKVRDENIPRVKMDTTLVYEAVFKKYGYDTDDYLYSVREYLKDPERFAKVFENVSKRLEGEVDALKKIIDHQVWVANQMGAKRPQLDSILAPFSKESVYVGLARVERDTSRYPAWFRLVAAQADTLMIPVDSLAPLNAKDPEDPSKEVFEEKAAPDKPSMTPRGKLRSPKSLQVTEVEEVAEEADQEAVAE